MKIDEEEEKSVFAQLSKALGSRRSAADLLRLTAKMPNVRQPELQGICDTLLLIVRSKLIHKPKLRYYNFT